MFRATSRSISRNVFRSSSLSGGAPARNRIPLRNASSAASGGGGGGGKVALFGSVAALSIAGGTLGYAGIDPEFRSYVEDNVPGAKDVFGTVLGAPEPAPKKPTPPITPPSKLKIPKESSLPVTSRPASSLPPPPPMPPLEKPEEPTAKEFSKVELKPESKPESSPDLKPVVNKKKEPKQKEENKDVKKKAKMGDSLSKTVEDLKVAVGMAALSGKQCVEAITKHGQLVVSVLEQKMDDSEGDKAWHDVIEAANVKSDALKSANEKLSTAKEQLNKLDKALAKTDKDSPDAKAADKEMEAAHDKLREITSEMAISKKDSYLIEQYRDLVEEGRQQFRKELAALLPGQAPNDPKQRQPMTEEEMNVFVTHAYRKVCHLEQQLAKLRLFQQQIDHSSMSDKELRKQVVTEEVVQVELDAQKRQFEVEHQQRMVAIREEMESEMRSQLRRQAAAHSDHIKDSLEVQQNEITRKFERKLDEALGDERANYRAEISKLTGAVQGLQTAIKDREKMQHAVKDAQELWLACSSLQRALQADRPESGVLPLAPEVGAIKHAIENLGSSNFVNAVMGSLPNEAINRGVYTDQTIRDRFFKVERMVKRTALIGDEGGSLMMYFLSYLQSMFVLTPSTETLPDPSIPVDIDSLNTFDIVWLARGCVERGDLEQAVKYMTLLKGEPRNVSSDWIREARLLLETRQVCEALLSHAAAYGLETFPEKK